MKFASAVALLALSLAAPASAASCSSTRAYEAAAHTMHQAMDITYTGDADIDFARGMVPHHQGAVDMVAVLLKNGKDQDLRKLGEWIARAQKLEIAEMSHWLAVRDNQHLPMAKSDDQVVIAYREAMEKMHHGMHISYTGDADLDFVNGMIPHHQGAIEMAEILMANGKDESLRAIARDVIRSQQQEIAWMQRWRDARKK